jgi:hypothetical protein
MVVPVRRTHQRRLCHKHGSCPGLAAGLVHGTDRRPATVFPLDAAGSGVQLRQRPQLAAVTRG